MGRNHKKYDTIGCMKKEIISTFLLFIAALCWGTSYTARKLGIVYVTPLFFNGLRFLLGCLFIFMIYFVVQKGRLDPSKSNRDIELFPVKTQMAGASLMGLFLALGAVFQQEALVYGSVGKIAFFTALYTIMVPMISAIFLRTKIPFKVWGGAVIAVIGIYLIGGGGNFSMTVSDVLALSCALTFAFQILLTGKYASKSNSIFLSMIQTLVAGTVNLILSLIFESGNTFQDVMHVFWPLMVSAFIAITIPYSLQIIAQRNAPPSIAAIVLSLESVFGAMFGAIILRERMSVIQITGCVLIFSAIIISQIRFRKK